MLLLVDKVAGERHALHNLTELLWPGRDTFSLPDTHSAQVLQQVKRRVSLRLGRCSFRWTRVERHDDETTANTEVAPLAARYKQRA